MAMEMHQRQSIDARVVVSWAGAEGLRIALYRSAQQCLFKARIVDHLFARSALPVPRLGPCILVDPSEQGPGLRILGEGLEYRAVVIARAIQRVAVLTLRRQT